MPGTPANSPRLAIPRFSNADTADFSVGVNSVVDALDSSAAGYLSGTDAGKGAASAANAGKFYLATDSGAFYYSDGTAWRTVFGSRGAVSIAGTESRTNVAYGTLATPDQVTGIVLPTNGRLEIGYQGTWQESVLGGASAAIFVGANQIKIGASGAASPGVQSAFIGGSWPTSTNCLLSTNSNGLSSLQGQVMPTTSAYGGDVTTGQVVGATIGLQTGMTAGQNVFQGGLCHVFAAAGTYTVSVQFKASSGSVTASGRKLWVRAISFG